jgi:hypothetical protein
MADLRTLLALVLGVGLGLVLIAAPEAILRVHTVGRLPRDRTGGYGEEVDVGPRWRRGIQVLGVVLVAVAITLWATS